MIRRLIVWLLALALLLGAGAVPAFAGAPEETPAATEELPPAETEEAPAETEEVPAETEEAPAETEEVPVGAKSSLIFADDGELTAVVEQALEESLYGTRLTNVPLSVAVCFTRSGEIWYYNADEWYYTASLYKLPMIMRFTRMTEEGELADQLPIFTDQNEYIKQRCLIYSDNSWAGALWRNLFTEDGVMQRIALEYSHFPENELPPEYAGNMIYSARFMLGIVQELYDNAELYPNVIDYMKQAQPNEYFRHELEGVYEVAQKYGSADGFNHTAGIIWTPSPILLVVMSNRLAVQLGDQTIGHVAAAVADYALVVDERADAWEKQEAERIAAEEAAAAAAAAEAAAQTPEPTAPPTPAPSPVPTPEPQPEPQQLSALWALLLIPAAAGAWLLLRRRGKNGEIPPPSGDGEDPPQSQNQGT